jgi:hypothetical protein
MTENIVSSNSNTNNEIIINDENEIVTFGELGNFLEGKKINVRFNSQHVEPLELYFAKYDYEKNIIKVIINVDGEKYDDFYDLTYGVCRAFSENKLPEQDSYKMAYLWCCCDNSLEKIPLSCWTSINIEKCEHQQKITLFYDWKKRFCL